jgi:hypothetical protein
MSYLLETENKGLLEDILLFHAISGQSIQSEDLGCGALGTILLRPAARLSCFFFCGKSKF